MKRPLIPVALLYVGGILLAGLEVSLTSLFIAAAAIALLFALCPAGRKILLCVFIILAGWINLTQRTAVLAPDDLRVRMIRDEESAVVRGVLRETPRHRVHEIKNREVWNSQASLEVSEIQINGKDWQPARGLVMSATRDLLPDTFFAGQTVEVAGVLRMPRGPVAEGLFDYRYFLRQQGIYYQLEANHASEWKIISSPARAPLADRFGAWARKSLAMGLPAEDESLRLEWALTLGWKAALTEEVAEPFVRASTYHIFAVDGLRIAIIAGIMLALLRVCGVPRAWCGMAIIPVLWFYASLTGWPASAIRAIVMIMVVFGGWILRRPIDLLSSLFAAALIILLWEPRQLFQAGFQLSFFVVLCLALIVPFFQSIGEHVLKPDPLLPESLQPRWKRILRDPLRWVIDLFLTSVAAWLGSIPLVAWYFHLITPMSGPANVLAVPLCMLVLVCNLTSLLLVTWLPFGAELFNHAGWFCMESIRTTSGWSAHWPGAYYYVAMPGIFTVALYYVILIGSLTGWLFRGNWRIWKLGAVAALALAWCGLWLWERPVSRLTFLPLNGGHAVYARLGGGRGDWLLDCGNEISVDSVVKPFLQAQGVDRLDNLLLTHGEINYSGGADVITELFPPQNIYTSAIHFRSPAYREFQHGTKNNPALRQPLQAGDALVPWTVLYPPAQTALKKGEDNALVLRGEIFGTRVLLFSDLSHAGQNALLGSGVDMRADIVIAGIPGDGEPLSDALLDAAQPRLIIVADSQQPAAKRAKEQLKERLAHRNIPVFYTTASDAVTVTLRSGKCEVEAMDGSKVYLRP